MLKSNDFPVTQKSLLLSSLKFIKEDVMYVRSSFIFEDDAEFQINDKFWHK